MPATGFQAVPSRKSRTPAQDRWCGRNSSVSYVMAGSTPTTPRGAPALLTVRIAAIRHAMRRSDMTTTQVAMRLGVSRQYVWAILRGRSFVSDAKLDEIERLVHEWTARWEEGVTAGRRMRAARLYAGFTLKEAADLIGYSWVAVERWEKDHCLPKPGVLWHLRYVYSVDRNWLPMGVPRNSQPRQTVSVSIGA